MALYNPDQNDPLFQMFSAGRSSVLIDSRIRKVLSKLNVKLGFPSNKYTFYTFRRSGATLAYNSNASLQSIKKHGSWSSDCVWTYIQIMSLRGRKLLRLSLGLYKYFPTSTGPFRVLYIYM